MKSYRFAILLVLGALIDPAFGEGRGDPPDSWAMAFHEEAREVWNRLLEDDGKVTANEVIAENYKGGSHHDGDRQLATAVSLIELEDDPVLYLRTMMAEKEPERRAYAVLVAGMIGDSRLISDIERLLVDNAELGQFSGDWFWDTVGDAAKGAMRDLKSGGVASKWIANGGTVATWLLLPESSNTED